MSGFVGPLFMAVTGTTGNNTSASVGLSPAANKSAFVFIVEAAGGGPTVTYKFQGTLDPTTVTDANANWADLLVLPIGSDTATAAPTALTATGVTIHYLAQAHSRFIRRARVVTSANTNITYRCELHQMYSN
jgi:hypothetical protein